MDLTKPLVDLGERVTGLGLTWMTEGPRGRRWVIGWNEARGGGVKGWDYRTGRTGFLGTASGVEEARSEALRIAGLIAAGKTRGNGKTEGTL